MKKIGIYKITNPNGKVYIGQSTDIIKRWNGYFRGWTKSQTLLHRSILKYGIKSHKFEIVEECEFEMLNIKERYWQDYYDVCNSHKGLNLILTNTDILPKRFSKESKQKMSLSRTGMKKTPEQIIALSKRTSKENNPMFSKNHSEESIEKIRQKAIGRRHNEIAKIKLSKIILSLETGIYYYGCEEASKAYGVSIRSINHQINPNDPVINKFNLIYV